MSWRVAIVGTTDESVERPWNETRISAYTHILTSSFYRVSIFFFFFSSPLSLSSDNNDDHEHSWWKRVPLYEYQNNQMSWLKFDAKFRIFHRVFLTERVHTFPSNCLLRSLHDRKLRVRWKNCFDRKERERE